MRIVMQTLSVAAAAILAGGCGGGGGSGNGAPGGGATPGSVTIVTDAWAIAYETGDGVWRENPQLEETLQEGLKRYRFSDDGKYGVACSCNDKHLMIFQMDTDETREVRFVCGGGHSASATMSGTVSDQTGTPDGYGVALERDYDIVIGSSGSYTLNAPPGTRDLVAVSLKSVNGKTVPQRFYIERGIDFSGTDTGHNITLTAANSSSVSGYALTGLHNSDAELYLVTENDTYFRTSVDGRWYIPDTGLREGDLYALYGEKKGSGNNRVTALKLYDAGAIAREDIDLDLSYLTPMSGVAYDNSAVFYGLAYQPSAQSLPFRSYLITMSKQSTDANVDLVLSAGWMSGANSYTVPDLSGLSDFANRWRGAQPDKVVVSALMSNLEIETMLGSERVFTPHDVMLFMRPGAQYEVATEELQ